MDWVNVSSYCYFVLKEYTNLKVFPKKEAYTRLGPRTQNKGWSLRDSTYFPDPCDV